MKDDIGCFNRIVSTWRSIQYRFVLLLASLLVCAGCSGATAQNRNPDTKPKHEVTETMHHESIARTYHIHLPPGFKKDVPAPLVIVLHGGGGNGKKFDLSTTQGTLTAAADKRGIVLVFPEGVKRQWSDGRTAFVRKTCDDVGFISKIIDTMVKNYGIDPGRVYATGISNGGFMSVRLAMELSGKIAAVAPVAAQLSKALKDKAPQKPISIMIVNGTKDPIVPFDGGHVRLFKFGRTRGEVLSTDSTIEHFRRHNACGKPPEKKQLPDRDPKDGTIVEIEKYQGSRHGTEVILVRVIGGGHTWPGGRQYLNPRLVGVVSREINASDMILDFFLHHSRKLGSAR